jgi:WD40 repeat protein
MKTTRLFRALPRVLTLGATLLCACVAHAETGYRWVAPPAYDDAGSAFEGVVPLRQGELWGLMGSTGAWRVPPRYEALGRPSEGHYPVKIQGKWGIVDLDGVKVIPPKYQQIGQWAERIPAKNDQGWMVLDKSGQAVYGPLPIDTLRGNEGHCIAGQIGDRAYVYADNTGLIYDEATGKLFKRAQPFVTSEGTLRLYRPSAGMIPFKNSSGAGFISCGTLKIVEGSEAEAVRRAVPENQLAAFRKNGLWGLMSVRDHGAQEVFRATHEGMREYTENRVPVKDTSGKWGYLNGSGELEIPATFDQAYSFSDGAAGVKVGDKRGFVYSDGSYAAEPVFEDFWRSAEGIAPVKLNGQWGVIAFDRLAPNAQLDFDPAALLDVAAPKQTTVLPSVPHKYFRQDFFTIQSIAHSTNGKLMATILDESEGDHRAWRSEVAVWDTTTYQAIARLHAPGVVSAAFIDDGAIIAMGEVDGHVSFWSTLGTKPLASIRPGRNPISMLSVSKSGSMLAASDGQTVWLWNLESGKMVASAAMDARAITMSSSGETVLVASGTGAIDLLAEGSDTITSWSKGYYPDAVTETRHGEMNILENVAISPDLTVAAVVSPLGTSNPRKLLVRHEGTWSQNELPENLYGASVIEISPDDKSIVVASPEVMALYRVADLRLIVEKTLVAQGHSDQIPQLRKLGPIDTLAFAPDPDRLFVVGSEGYPIVEYHPTADQIVDQFGAEMNLPVFGAQATLSGARVFFLTGDGEIRVFDLETAQPATSIPPSALPVSEFEPHGYLFTGPNGQVFYEVYDGPALRIDPKSLEYSNVPQGESVPPSGGSAASDEAIALLRKLNVAEPAIVAGANEAGMLMLQFSSGILRLVDIERGRWVASLVFLRGEEWAIATDEGFYDGTLAGIQSLSAVEGLSARPVVEALPQFHRPDMVRLILAGDPDGIAQREAELIETSLASVSSEPVTAPVLPGLGLSLGATEQKGPAASKPESPALKLPGVSFTTEGTD